MSARSGKKGDGAAQAVADHLAAGRLFEAEQAGVKLLETAFAAQNFASMAAVLPHLRDARRAKRQAALATGHVQIIQNELPETAADIKPGCYVVRPPRVGVDGRAMREMGDRAQVPVLVLVREPRTRSGQVPVVSIGPVTVRTRVAPPPGDDEQTPPASWVALAVEAIGDAAVEDCRSETSLWNKLEGSLLRLQAHPDHDGLHDALLAACSEAAAQPKAIPRPKRVSALEDAADELG